MSDDKKLKLNDILHLTKNQIANTKIGLNMGWQGRTHFLDWYESDPNERNTDFTYHSHQGKQRNFTSIGQLCFGFVRLQESDDKWLLVSVGEITSIPSLENIGTCGHRELPEFSGLVGRLIVSYHKGNTYSRYIFNAAGLIDKIEVSEILPNIYEPIKFEGFENVHLPFKTLKLMLEGVKYADYRAALSGVKGIYCITDMRNGKLYIGSASGEDGILQRWNEYKNSFTGGNVGLKDLLDKNGEEYFVENFTYTLLEFFPKNTPLSYIYRRENYWKEVFKTRIFGYNKN